MKESVLSELGRRTLDPPISWLMKMTLEMPQLISLGAGFTDNTSLPVMDTRELVRAILKSSKSGQQALQYGSTLGDIELRRLTAARLQALDLGNELETMPAVYDPNRLLITNGSQQFLYLVTEALCNQGDIVLVEDPTYFVFLSMAQGHGLQCRAVRMKEDGIDPDHLLEVLESLRRARKLKFLKFVYLVTYFQNPSGRTTSFARKTAVLELLRKYERFAGHPIFLVEDAAYRELRFSGMDVPSSLASFSDRVIYAGTYSKPFATGIRVGYGLLPEFLHKVVQRIKGNHDFGTANFLQQLLSVAVSHGAYQEHLRRIRNRYAKKARIMTRAIEENFPKSVIWEYPTGGLYIWAQMPGAIKTGIDFPLFKMALAKGVLYVPGEMCYARDSARTVPDQEIRLSFGGASEQDITIGIQRLGKAIRSIIKS